MHKSERDGETLRSEREHSGRIRDYDLSGEDVIHMGNTAIKEALDYRKTLVPDISDEWWWSGARHAGYTYSATWTEVYQGCPCSGIRSSSILGAMDYTYVSKTAI